MIALDANVLVRFLVEDDAAQTARARRLLQEAIDRDRVCFVSEVVVCEVVWVLTSRYRFPKERVVEVLSQLLRARPLRFAAPERVARALEAFASAGGDFADYLIREQAKAAGFEVVATFDRALRHDAGFQILE